MMTNRRALFALLAASALAGCIAPPPPPRRGGAGNGPPRELTVRVLPPFGDPIPLRPGSRAIVTFYDAATTQTVVEREFAVEALPSNIVFSIPRGTFRGVPDPAVSVQIEGPRGRVNYVTDRRVDLPRGRGSPTFVEVPVIRFDR